MMSRLVVADARSLCLARCDGGVSIPSDGGVSIPSDGGTPIRATENVHPGRRTKVHAGPLCGGRRRPAASHAAFQLTRNQGEDDECPTSALQARAHGGSR